MEQEIRLVCIDTSPSITCSHLFSHTGPENKIVRMPKKCGKNPFARVAEVRNSTNQHLPPTLAKQLWKRDGRLPGVYTLRLDTDFHEIDPRTTGPVRFAVEGISAPGVEHNINTHAQAEGEPNRLVERGHKDIVAHSINSLKHLVSKAGATRSKNFHANYNGNITLYKQTINCPPLYPTFEIDLNPSIHAQGTIAIAASGSIVPPKVGDIATISGLSADVDATLSIRADVLAVFDTGRKKIYESPIPELIFPGIFSSTPKLQIYVQSKVTLSVGVGARIGINYYAKNAVIHFPPKRDTHVDAGLKHSTSDLKLKVTPFAQAYGQTEAKLIPQISFDMKMFGKESNLAVRAETTAYLRIEGEAHGNAHNINPHKIKLPKIHTHNTKKRGLDEISLERRDGHLVRQPMGDLVLGTRTADDPSLYRYGYGPSPSKTSTMVKRSPGVPALRKRASPAVGPQPTAGGNKVLDNSATRTLALRVWVDITLDINVGTDNTIGALDRNSKFSLYKHTWTLWQRQIKKAFPNSGGNNHKRALDPLRTRLLPVLGVSPFEPSSLFKRGLKCPSTSISAAMTLGLQNIQGSTTIPFKKSR
ncbi:hypothetical protein AX15_006438 [Amanita polypyramis BW_CC]|nr:hypothetical protein AX15_006438 [Amanita polypyramis BW_CC]